MTLAQFFERWWRLLAQPLEGADYVLAEEPRKPLDALLPALVVGLYLFYGLSMGLFSGWYPALLTGAKTPLLYGAVAGSLALPGYVQNQLCGPGASLRAVYRFLLLSLSAHAATLASCAPISYLFALTTSPRGYPLLVAMHLGHLALASTACAATTVLLWRAVYRRTGQVRAVLPIAALGLAGGMLFVQMLWAMRPWVGVPGATFGFMRSRESTPIDALMRLLDTLLGS